MTSVSQGPVSKCHWKVKNSSARAAGSWERGGCTGIRRCQAGSGARLGELGSRAAEAWGPPVRALPSLGARRRRSRASEASTSEVRKLLPPSGQRQVWCVPPGTEPLPSPPPGPLRPGQRFVFSDTPEEPPRGAVCLDPWRNPPEHQSSRGSGIWPARLREAGRGPGRRLTHVHPAQNAGFRLPSESVPTRMVDHYKAIRRAYKERKPTETPKKKQKKPSVNSQMLSRTTKRLESGALPSRRGEGGPGPRRALLRAASRCGSSPGPGPAVETHGRCPAGCGPAGGQAEPAVGLREEPRCLHQAASSSAGHH
ncbi:hypothetical protein R6Z07F_014577 [Ovis aries]